jgi:branched-chain amino acid transport system ATP-binding protein
MADDLILETEGLTKEFKGFVAVSNVNLRVRRGIVGDPAARLRGPE